MDRSTRLVIAGVIVAVLGSMGRAGAQDAKTDAKTDAMAGPLVLKDGGSFFVGGKLQQTDAVSGNPQGPGGFGYPNTDTITVNQMYVQFQVPVQSAGSIPIVMIHGCCLSAKSWEETPDGRMGWSEYLVRRHHAVYLPDQSSRARSGFDATTINEVALGLKPANTLPRLFTFGRNSAWDLFRFGPRYPEVWPDQQFPMEALEEFSKQVIPDANPTLPDPNPTFANLARTAVLAGGAVVIGHSESGFFPEQAALADGSGVRGMVSIEGRCPVLSDAQVATLAKAPVLFIFGDHIDGSDVSKALWTKNVSDCTRVTAQLNAAGGKAELWELPKRGLHGNSHMLMMDRNNLQIADMILEWISRNVDQTHGPALVGRHRNEAD